LTEINHFQHELDSATIKFDSKLDWDIANLLSRTGLTISVSESITQGLLSHRLSNASKNNFHGGIICSHPLITINLCSVSPASLKQHGSASKEIALEMVRGLKKIAKTNIYISTTGIDLQQTNASATSTRKIFIGFIINGMESVKSLYIEGTRNYLQTKTTQATLVFLRQFLLQQDETHFAVSTQKITKEKQL
jgi:PncC family amidohydrolase